jgi:glutamyl-tRNA synthetase
VPDTVVEFTDLVHGEQVFDMNQVDDFILVDSKANALFLLSNVIDDHTMQLNPVIRGEDHLPNTPRQILIYRALGLPIPEFGHLPLILNPDGTKMSKRSGGTVVQEYRERGFLPEALNNYLALLGWTPAENREIFALDELVELFELERLSDSPSRFDSQKLNWLNNQWIQKLETEDLASRFLPFLSRDGLVGSPPSDREKDLVHQVAPLVQQRVHTLEEVSKWMRPFLEHPSGIRFQMFPDNMSSAEIRQLLAETRRCLTLTEPFDADSIRIDLDQLVTSLGYSKRRLFMCIRIAVTGSRVSPPLYESLEILGRGVVLKRLERAEDELD